MVFKEFGFVEFGFVLYQCVVNVGGCHGCQWWGLWNDNLACGCIAYPDEVKPGGQGLCGAMRGGTLGAVFVYFLPFDVVDRSGCRRVTVDDEAVSLQGNGETVGMRGVD